MTPTPVLSVPRVSAPLRARAVPHRRAKIESTARRRPPKPPGSVLTVMTNAATPATAAKPKTRMFVVYGFLCNTNRAALRQRFRDIRKVSGNAVDTVEVLCNAKHPQSMTYDIWKRLVDSGQLLEPTPFVRDVIAKVCRALRRGERVILVGHSYGGSVASRVALYLLDQCDALPLNALARVHIATLGSIFIPPARVTTGIDIRHYAYPNDVALLCSRRCPNVTFLPARYRNGIKAHMDYDDVILHMAATACTHLTK